MKRWLLTGPFECYLPVAPGLEDTLVTELLDLGLAAERGDLRSEHGGVSLKLDHTGIMRANLCLRTASRVLLRLGTVPAATPEMLYDRARKLDWLVHLGFQTGYRLRVSSRRSKLQAGDQVTNTVASAVARHMREHGLYPKPDDEAPLEFHVRLADDRCTISLDTSGQHLHKRGVRTHIGVAPLRETIAAGMALIALRDVEERPDVIVDPFCGSGTVLIELTDVLTGAAPGRHRGFAFQNAAWFRPGKWREVQRQAAAAVLARGSEALPRMIGIDVDPYALAAARANLAGDEYAHVELIQADSTAFDFGSLDARNGMIIGNAPFGVRLGDWESASQLVARFLAQVADVGKTWFLCLLMSDTTAVLEHPDLHTVMLQSVTSGGLDTAIVTSRMG